jgi:hypothetical protein
MRVLAWLLAGALFAAPVAVPASGSASSSYRSTSSSSHRSKGVRHSHGKSKRDPAQRHAFMKTHPCPSTGKTSGACPGYQVDHRTALACGGADSPENMQWLSVAEHKAKHAHGAGCATR